MSDEPVVDLLVIGAGPTGLAIGVEARKAGLEAVLVDRGPLAANLLGFPTFMNFFTTRDLLEIGGIPFAVPEDKPDRRQAITYYQSVARAFDLRLALHEEVTEIVRRDSLFEVVTRSSDRQGRYRARAVALATGYFHNPRRLVVPGSDLPWVHTRYLEPYPHFGEDVVVVGGGNSAVETALDLWRNGSRVTLVHRGGELKRSLKYWLKPDFENRVAEGSVAARMDSRIERFDEAGVWIEGPAGKECLPAQAAYVLIGYLPDVELQRAAGVQVDPETLVPTVDPATCESNVPGLYIAGTLQAGRDTGRIFIENSREHGLQIVRHLSSRLTAEPDQAARLLHN